MQMSDVIRVTETVLPFTCGPFCPCSAACPRMELLPPGRVVSGAVIIAAPIRRRRLRNFCRSHSARLRVPSR